MPKSKRSIKRRKKIKGRKPQYIAGIDPYDKDSKGIGSTDGSYVKTDGQSRVCKYDANHKFLGYATKEESENF